MLTRRPSTLAIVVAIAGALVASSLGAGNAFAAGGDRGDHRGGFVYTLDPSTHGNPEGVAVDPRSGAFFVGALGDGTVYRGTTADRTMRPFIAGSAGLLAVGMKVARGRLYVAGGSGAQLRVYDVASGALLTTVDTPGGGFLNDLVITERGDVWVTDSFVPVLWHTTEARVAAARGGRVTADRVPVDIPFVANSFNLNGIVALNDGARLVTVQSSTGDLWRVDVGRRLRVKVTKIGGPGVLAGDGLLLDHGRLVAIQGFLNQLTFLELDRGARTATVVGSQTDAVLEGPTTLARQGDRYLVVNADFATNTPPFTLASLPRDD